MQWSLDQTKRIIVVSLKKSFASGLKSHTVVALSKKRTKNKVSVMSFCSIMHFLCKTVIMFWALSLLVMWAAQRGKSLPLNHLFIVLKADYIRLTFLSFMLYHIWLGFRVLPGWHPRTIWKWWEWLTMKRNCCKFNFVSVDQCINPLLSWNELKIAIPHCKNSLLKLEGPLYLKYLSNIEEWKCEGA